MSVGASFNSGLLRLIVGLGDARRFMAVFSSVAAKKQSREKMSATCGGTTGVEETRSGKFVCMCKKKKKRRRRKKKRSRKERKKTNVYAFYM